MSTAQLQELMAQVEQLTLVNSRLQQELTNNSTHLARLESAMHKRRGVRGRDDESAAAWSGCSSSRSSRSEEQHGGSLEMDQLSKPADSSSLTTSHGASKKDSGLSAMVSNTNVRPRQRPEALDGDWPHERRERRDSGSCDHTESEMNGVVYRDVSTNTPPAQQVHFAQLPGADHAVGPAVVSSDRHGNELITIGTQTTEVVMTTDCEHEAVVENVRGCSKAATPQQLSDFYHGAWPIVVDGESGSSGATMVPDTQSVMSFHSSISSHSSRPSHHFKEPSNKETSRVANQVAQNAAEIHSVPIALQPLSGNQPLGSKVQMVYSLLSMLGTHDPEDMSQTLLAMSSSSDSCVAMRQSGCLPLLVQLIYGSESDKESMAVGRVCRARACKALHNIIHSPPDDKRSRKEVKILKYLEIVQAHCEVIREDEAVERQVLALAESIWPPSDIDRDPGPAVAALMKLSFDDHGRQPICALGGLHCMSQLIKFDQSSYSASSDIQRVTMRRYACMTLTNLTYGDSANKTRLCAMQSCLDAIVLQLQSFNEDLCQVAASVIRNLSWKADQASKRHLRLSRAATKLMITAIQVGKESTLKSILSALWNLSAHCTHNKTCICEVDGSIEFLVNMLSYQSPSKTLAIVECAGGILRNISSVIAVRDDYRQILRNHNALETLLSHLKSPSLAIVGNACGALWNISARCLDDQKVLIDLSAIPMLKNLTSSKHRLISLGSAATIKNLMAFKTEGAGAKAGRSAKHTSRRREGTEVSQPDSPSKLKSLQDHSNSSSTELSTSKVQRADSQDSVGSCSSLTNREGLITLNKIENIMQEVIQANMEIHQVSRFPTSTHSSDTRINSGSSTPRSKAAASNFTMMSKSSEYPLQANTNPVRQIGSSTNNAALSPRVHHKRTGAAFGNPTPVTAGAFFSSHVPSLHRNEDRFSVRSGGSGGAADDASARANLSMTYNDDNIDNSSEKPVDYSQMYQENGSVYELPVTGSGNATAGYRAGALSRQQLNYSTNQLPAAFLHHDPAMLLQTSSGSFMDPSYFMDLDVPSLEQIKAKAMCEKPAAVQQRTRPVPLSGQPAANSSRAMPELSRIDDQHGEDQVRTFCTEGTPMNYLSTATSMNELNKIGEEPILEKDEQSLSSQATTTVSGATQESVKVENVPADSGNKELKTNIVPLVPKRQEDEDEPPRTYATEDTPLTGISRVSSLSSLTSAMDGRLGASEGMSRETAPAPLALPVQGGLERIHEDEVLSPAPHSKAPPLKTPIEQKSVSFDEHAHVQETPMMFSRASSLASLSSCDQHSIHSSVFSDYSRRASQVVSPSELPDSPGGTTHHSPTTRRKLKERSETRKESQTPPLLRTEQPVSIHNPALFGQPTDVPADSNTESVTNLLGLSGMFGSLSGLASLQGPGVDDDITNNYTQRLLNQYCQPSNPSAAVQQQYQLQHVPAQQQQQLEHMAQYYRQGAVYRPPQVMHVPPMRAYSGYPVSQQLNRQLNPQQQAVRHQSPAEPVSMAQPIAEENNASQDSSCPPDQHTSALPTTRPGILRSAPAPASTAPPVAPTPTAAPKLPPVDRAAINNNKVDQFLCDTVRTYAVEGTPGPNSSRSSLSALTFLDEPDVPLSTLPMMKSSFSKESISSSTKANDKNSKPLDLSIKSKPQAHAASEPQAEGATEPPPPLPPKPASLGQRKKDKADGAVHSRTDQSAASSAHTAGSGSSAMKPSHTPGRSRTTSDSMHDSDSSSEGDDFMLQQGISSALPRNKLPKSSSDSLVTSGSNKQSSGSSGVPRSKTTFGSKLRMPSRKTLKAAQLAKQRQAPPIVSANSPTPDDDYFAEETVMAYCTEDTPYNKSSATSLSDLSVIDDDLNEMEKSDGEGTASKLDVTSVAAGSKQHVPPADPSASDTSSDSDGEDMLSNAIFSAIPKKSGNSSQPVTAADQTPIAGTPATPDHVLKCTSNELRATDVKFQTSADSIRNYATEGTPNNFSTSTSLSDLTIDSHYSTTKSSRSTSKPPAAPPAAAGKHSTTSHSSPSRQPSLLPKRQGTVMSPQLPTSRLPQASSSPMNRGAPGKLLQAHRGPQSSYASCAAHAANLSDHDEMRSFGVEGTPFNYSRRESLSSLSCDDDDEDDEVNITIIKRVNEAMAKRMQETKSASGGAQTTSSSPAMRARSAGAEAKAERKVTLQTTSRPSMVVSDGIIKKFNLPPPSDGFQSRDEVTKAYTPIEGTPYCFSRNSPLSSLSGSSDSSGEADDERNMANITSINEAHQAEGGITDSSDSDSDASQGSFSTGHAFLEQCISSALPKKTSTLPRANKLSTTGASSLSYAQVKVPASTSKPAVNKSPPQLLPKPVHAKPSPVNLLPSSGEMVVSQRSSKGVSTDTSTDSIKSDVMSTTSTSPCSVSTVYKSTQERRMSLTERELRRRTYTVTASDIQSAIALIPPAGETNNFPTESNIEISGDEDEFDDVFLLENGELFRQDVDTILAALGQAAREQEEQFLDVLSLSLPQPPSCFADDMVVFENGGSDRECDATDREEIGDSETIDTMSNCVTATSLQVSQARHPRITKPDLSKPISSLSADREKSKAIRGRRKPLYPGKKLMQNNKPLAATPKTNIASRIKPPTQRQSRVGVVTKAPPTVTPDAAKNSTRASRQIQSRFSSSKTITSPLTNGSSSSRAISKGGSTNIPQVTVRSPAKGTPKANPSLSRNSITNQKASSRERSTAGHLPKTNNKTVESQKGAGGVQVALRTNAKSPIAKPNSISKNTDTVHESTKTAEPIFGLVELSPTTNEDKVEDRREKLGSPSTVLHRAAGDGEKKTIANPSSFTPRPTSHGNSTKPQAVSKIAGLWKSKPTQSLTCANKSKHTGASKKPGSVKSAPPDMAMRKPLEKLTYVSSISFREQSDRSTSNTPSNDQPSHSHTNSLSTGNSHCTDQLVDSAVDISTNTVAEEPISAAEPISGCSEMSALPATASMRPSDSKNSARVSPFMYKQPVQRPSTPDPPAADTADTLTADFTSQASFYGQENKITVHLDIKPCITLSDVSHSRAIEHPPQHHLPSSSTKSATEPTMTKTEMLLRRRSEILSRRHDSTSPWQPSKSTDV